MILFFDKFVDTREKRYHLLLLLLLLCALWMVIACLIVAFQLLQLQNYNDLFALLKTSYVEWTYLSRIIVDAISITKLTIPNVIACLIDNLSIIEMLAVLLTTICYQILEKKKITMIVLLLFAIEVFGSCGFAILGLQAQTLSTVIYNLRLMGILMISINVILILIFLYYSFCQFKYYKISLQYTALEIKEHID